MLKLLHQIFHSFYDLKLGLFTHTSRPQYTITANSPLETQVENFLDFTITDYKINYSNKLGYHFLEQLLLLKQIINDVKQLLQDHLTDLPQYPELRNKVLKLFIAGVLYDLNKLLRDQNKELVQNLSLSLTDNQVCLNKLFSRFLSDTGCFSLFSFLLIKNNDDWQTAITNLLMEHPEPEIQKIAVSFYQNTTLNTIHKKYFSLKSCALITHENLQEKTSALQTTYNLATAFSE